MNSQGQSTIDAAEVERFSRMAAQWWDPRGKFRPLHKFNPVRLEYVRETVIAHFGLDGTAARPFDGLRFLDIGCGGGLLSEPMTRLGASVTGADASEVNIEVARIHAAESGLEIDYRATTAEALAEAGERFDVVLNMESLGQHRQGALGVSQFMQASGQTPSREVDHRVRLITEPRRQDVGVNDFQFFQ